MTWFNSMAIWLQAGGAFMALAALAVWPPAHGRMLIVPVGVAADRPIAATLIDRGAMLLGQGYFRGSLVVQGDRDHLTKGLLRQGILVIAAPAVLCGEDAA